MNSLSWMIYLADVCSNVGFPAVFFCIIATIAAIISTVVRRGSEESTSSDAQAATRISTSIQRASIPIAVVAFLLSVFVPSKDTVYAIAASEAGEEVLRTPEATKARQALNAWLDKQIGEQKPEQSK